MNVANSVKRPKVEAPKVEAPKVEAPKVEAPKVEPPKVEAPKVEAPKVDAWEGARSAALARGVTHTGLTPLYAVHTTAIGDVLARIEPMRAARQTVEIVEADGTKTMSKPLHDDGSPSVKAAVSILKALSKGATLADILALTIVEADDVASDRKAVKSAQLRGAADKAATGAPIVKRGK